LDLPGAADLSRALDRAVQLFIPFALLLLDPATCALALPNAEHATQNADEYPAASESDENRSVPTPDAAQRARDDASDLATRVSAWSAFASAVFALMVWYTTRKQVTLANDALKLARDEFNAAHRPQLIIHAMRDQGSEEGRIAAVLVYANIGRTDATVVEVAYQIYVAGTNELRPISPSRIEPRAFSQYVSCGAMESYRLKGQVSKDEFEFTRFRQDASGGPLPRGRIICRGYMRYEDARGVRRQLGFCRSFDGHEWQRVDNPEYDYSY
jgi:hypothetical protein